MSTMPQVLLLAAGNSTRIHPISKGRPKPLLDIGGDAIIAHNLRWLAAEGVDEVVVNLHYRPDEIRDFVGDGRRFGPQVSYSFEPEILGTAGAARKLSGYWADRFIVVYGDNLLSTDLSHLIAEHVRHSAMATVAVFDHRIHPHTGIAGGRVRIDGTDRVVAFAEGAGDDVSPLVNAGVYVLELSVLDHVPKDGFCDFGKDVFPSMLRAGQRLFASSVTGFCLGLDTPEAFQRAGELVKFGKVQLR
jgi:mannose-1-phosphate guanylyltransferase